MAPPSSAVIWRSASSTIASRLSGGFAGRVRRLWTSGGPKGSRGGTGKRYSPRTLFVNLTNGVRHEYCSPGDRRGAGHGNVLSTRKGVNQHVHTHYRHSGRGPERSR